MLGVISKYNPVAAVTRFNYTETPRTKNKDILRIELMGKTYCLEKRVGNNSGLLCKVKSRNGQLNLKHNDTASSHSRFIFYYDARLKEVVVYPTEKYMESKKVTKDFTMSEIMYLKNQVPVTRVPTAPTLEELS